MTLLQRLFFVVLLFSPSVSWSLPLTDVGYDPLFQRHWARFIPQHDWHWGKSQCYQESLLEPRAVSPVGAMGLCQFMPATHAECVNRLRLPDRSSPFNPQISALCSAWYVSIQIRIWKSPRPKTERLYLAQASYNAGAGNIIKAQKLCGMPSLWNLIKVCLPQVTGVANAHETVTYQELISKWYVRLDSNRNNGINPIRPAVECRAQD